VGCGTRDRRNSGRCAGPATAARTEEETMATKPEVRRDRTVIIRDLVIFQIKLFLDGLKDVVIAPMSIGAAALDLLFPTARRGARFYAVMRVGERIDRWLNLFGASERAGEHEEGLFGTSRAGSDSLLGKIESYVLGHDEPETDSGEKRDRYTDEVFAGTR